MIALSRPLKRSLKRLFYLPLHPRLLYAIAEPLFRFFGRRRTPANSPNGLGRRVLVVRLDAIGDLVLTTPFLRELRRSLTDAHITLVVKPETRALVEFCPYVDEVLTFKWEGRRWLAPFQARWRALRFSARYLWPRKFDLALVPRWDADRHEAMTLGYLSGAPARIGYSIRVNPTKATLNRSSEPLLTYSITRTEPRHEVERNLDILRVLGFAPSATNLEIWFTASDEGFVDELLSRSADRSSERVVAVGIGAGAPHREWPVEKIEVLIRWLIHDRRSTVILVGGLREESRAHTLQELSKERLINAVGRTSLRQTAALLGRCDLFVGNDSGPMHLASVVGIPVVEISCHPRGGDPLGENAPERFAPWGISSCVLRPPTALPPCSTSCRSEIAHCIATISVAEVQAAVDGFLRNIESGASRTRLSRLPHRTKVAAQRETEEIP
jgi:ADP-heptose:LPS heptosyltransferase